MGNGEANGQCSQEGVMEGQKTEKDGQDLEKAGARAELHTPVQPELIRGNDAVQ